MIFSDSKTQSYFNTTAKYYTAHYTDKGDNPLVGRYLEYLFKYCRDKKVLEVGCGPATFLGEVSAIAHSSFGVDFAKDMLQIARSRCHITHLIQADANSLPFKNSSFEVVYSLRVFQHIRLRECFLREASRVLIEGGTFLFDFVNFYNPLGIGRWIASSFPGFVYLRADKQSDLVRLCSQHGLKVISVYPLQFLLDTANMQKYFPCLPARLFKRNSIQNARDVKKHAFFFPFFFRLLLVCTKSSSVR